MTSNVVKIEQCFPYMVYKNKASAFAISVLASYLYKLQNIHHIILRHHPWASVGYHHGEPESVENDSLGDRVTTRPRYRAPVLFLLRAG